MGYSGNFISEDKKEKKLYPAFKNDIGGRKYGYIDYKGQFIIEPKFNVAYNFNEHGTAIVENNQLFGLINMKGKYILRPTYDSINEYKDNRAVYVTKDGMGVINEEGKVITKKNYDYVQDYSEKRAVIGENLADSTYVYGYIDVEGNEVIGLQFLEASSFKDDVALVKMKNGHFALIDRKGKLISDYDYNYVGQYGDGLMVFAEDPMGPYGYINKAGEVIIKPKYKSAEGFQGGIAKVSESDGFIGPYGAINMNGTYIYSPIYSDIKYLNSNRVAIGMNLSEDKYNPTSIYALGDVKGRIITDFKYLDIGLYHKEITYSSNETKTFFIDKEGNVIKSLPMVKGSGELLKDEDIIIGKVDYETYYLKPNGKVIYEPNTKIPLSSKYSVERKKLKPNINYLIYYPKIKITNEKIIEKTINDKLWELCCFMPWGDKGVEKHCGSISPQDVLDYSYYGDFIVEFYRENLLVLDIMGYYYPFGAAHGMPYRKTPSIDLTTGEFYSIGDLFMGGVYWLGELNKIIEHMIASDPQYEYVYKDGFKTISFEQDFYVDDENLYVYFPPYEIAPYSAGFVTFKIPFDNIQGMINKRGNFYKAFN